MLNLLKSIYTLNPLHNEPHHAAPTSPDVTTPLNPSTVYRGRATQISGDSQFSQISAFTRQYAGDEEMMTWMKLLGLKEQNKFLQRVCSSRLILKTFARKNVPSNLCFMWQEETFQKQKSEENRLQAIMNRHHWDKLTNAKRKSLRVWKSKKKKQLLNKFKKLINHHHDWQKVKCTKGSKHKKTFRSTAVPTI